MRAELAAMAGAGIKRARFKARFEGRFNRGMLKFSNVQTPIGVLDHFWTKPERMLSPVPRKGKNVEFIASIEPYLKDDLTEDYHLVDIKVIK